MPQPFSIFGLMMMVHPESQGLEGDDEDGGDDDDSEESGNSGHSERPSPLSKSNDSRDDNQTEDLGEPRLSYMVKDKRVGLAKPALEFEEEDQEFQEPFYEDMGMSDSLAGDEEPSLTYHLPGHQRGPALLKASTAPSGFHESFQHSSGQHLGTEATATRACAGDHYVGHPESSTGAEPHVLHEEDSEDRESPSLQPTYESLRQENILLRSENEMLRNVNLVLMSENFALRQVFKELKDDSAVLVGEDVMPREEYDVLRKQYDRLEGENAALRKDNAMVRRMLNTFQYNLKRQVCMVSSLQDQLKASQAEREREVRELQSLAQQSECHLQLMSQRVLDAEINMERLKQKIFILQGQLEKSKLENENRRTDWPGSSEAQLRLQQAKPPRAHNGQKWLPQAAPASGMLPVVAEVLESTRKILKF
ncbi:uncharacterized protein LOC116443300 [Corvus moneduloides]|uniref:uncharacterized protein LOC116443300 n=1 Tax=Corvus moneduloides TaxID=1196302 RepID=UPI001363B3D4|nr:uncharacterized protein LOC116443300 [Corvus moneduloides]